MKKKFVVFLGVIGLFGMMPFMVNAEDLTSNLTLSSNTNACYTVKSGSNVTLNLAGYTLTNDGDCNTLTIEKGATLTITGNGTVDNVNHGKAAVFNNGTTTIENGTFTRSKSVYPGNTYYVILNHGTMTIKNADVSNNKVTEGGSLIANGYYNYSDYSANLNEAHPTLTIENGTYSGGNATIKNDDGGKVIIKGGTFKDGLVALQNVDDAEISGGSFSSVGEAKNPGPYLIVNSGGSNDDNESGSLKITGGTFDQGTNSSLIGGSSAQEASNVTISSGTFNGILMTEDENTTATLAVSGGTFKASTTDGDEINKKVVEKNKVQGAQELVADDGTVYLGYKVTIHYVDSNGKTIATDTVNYYNANEAYQTTPISISGYTKASVKGNETGKSAYDNVEVTYVYNKNTMFRESTIENPNTLDNIGLFFAIATISLLGLGITFNKLKKD